MQHLFLLNLVAMDKLRVMKQRPKSDATKNNLIDMKIQLEVTFLTFELLHTNSNLIFVQKLEIERSSLKSQLIQKDIDSSEHKRENASLQRLLKLEGNRSTEMSERLAREKLELEETIDKLKSDLKQQLTQKKFLYGFCVLMFIGFIWKTFSL